MTFRQIREPMSKLALFLLSFLLLLIQGCASIEASNEAGEATGPNLVKLFYATGRQPSTEPAVYYGSERADLAYGNIEIGIPARHLVGQLEQPSLLKFEYSADDREHITIQRNSNYTRESFYYFLNQAIDRAASKKLLIFVHGYNVEFSEAAKSLGQFANDLKFSPVVLFSWPSKGTLSGYTVDETNAEWAQSQFLELMNGILDNTQAQEIQVVGHSMGTRLIGRGMGTLASDRPEGDMSRFRNVVLIAPDIDSDVFRRDMAPRLERANIHVTLYASSGDSALMASKAFHGYARAGDSGEGLVTVPGVETIDASIAAGGLLGHSYFTEDPRIIGDLFSLLQSRQRADNRFALRPVNDRHGRHWVFRK